MLIGSDAALFFIKNLLFIVCEDCVIKVSISEACNVNVVGLSHKLHILLIANLGVDGAFLPCLVFVVVLYDSFKCFITVTSGDKIKFHF